MLEPKIAALVVEDGVAVGVGDRPPVLRPIE
jgi:hypothetical protein